MAMALSVVRPEGWHCSVGTGPLPDPFIHEFIQVLTRVSGRIPHAACLSSATGMQARQPSLLHVHEGKGCAAAAHFQWQAYMTFDKHSPLPNTRYMQEMGTALPTSCAGQRRGQGQEHERCKKDDA